MNGSTQANEKNNSLLVIFHADFHVTYKPVTILISLKVNYI